MPLHHSWCNQNPRKLMTATAFAHHGRETSASEAERRLNVSGDADLGSFGWDSIAGADHPQGSGSVFYFIHSGSECAPRVDDAASNGDFAISETCWIAVDVGNRSPRRTCGSRHQDGD